MESIHSSDAPDPIGPYSQAIEHGGLLFLSGQIPLDPGSGALVGESIETQAKQVLRNIGAILRAAHTGWDRVLRVTVYMTDLAEFPSFNRIYGESLGSARPARSTVQVTGLPMGARLEIDLIATR